MQNYYPGEIYLELNLMNKPYFLIVATIVSIMTSHQVKAQIDTVAGGPLPPKNDTAVLVFVEEMPQFPGGQVAMQEYLQSEIIYPKDERRAGKEGTVYVSFIVERDGRIDSVWLRKGVPNAPGLGTEAVRVIEAMPQWEPGRMNGKAVRVEMTLPIKFVLEGRKKKRK